jgi:uncharacterized protein YbaR (Trm112 family)
MKHQLMEIICCPVCKGDLTLKVDKEEQGEIIEGSLTCSACTYPYKITEGIPNLLPPELQK